MNCDKTKETSAHILTPYKRSIILVFGQEERLVGDSQFYLKLWAKLTPFIQKTPIFNRYLLAVPQP